jgi:hypothetical protein
LKERKKERKIERNKERKKERKKENRKVVFFREIFEKTNERKMDGKTDE